jgi:RIO kinase 1
MNNTEPDGTDRPERERGTMNEPEFLSDDAQRIQELLAEEQFNPGFAGRYREYMWIKEALGGFWADRLFTEVLYRVKAGKEATVYCLRGGQSVGQRLIAAKIYRPRMFRAMHNDWVYRQGRDTLDEEGKAVRDRRGKLAIRKKTHFGKHLMTASWNLNEYRKLCLLHAAGANVPRPIAHGHNAILMEYLGDEAQAAPILHGLRLGAEEAAALFDRLLRNIELFLANDLIHGDLSAYNVLYWKGEATIIDLPQAVQASTHPQALSLLSRDVERICQYFSRQGVAANATEIACDLWERFTRAEL